MPHYQIPWAWHPTAETCRSLLLVMNCVSLSAFVGSHIDYCFTISFQATQERWIVDIPPFYSKGFKQKSSLSWLRLQPKCFPSISPEKYKDITYCKIGHDHVTAAYRSITIVSFNASQCKMRRDIQHLKTSSTFLCDSGRLEQITWIWNLV